VKAVEFESQVAPSDQIPIPGDIARQIPAGSNVRVIVMWGDDEQDDWRDLARQRFASAYAPEDAVYEKLIDDPPSR
jgi:hypothetical protein